MAEQTDNPRPRALVRSAKKSDKPQLIAVLTRSFIHDPVMNWFGSAKTLVLDANPEGKSPAALKTIRGLAVYYDLFVELLFLLGANLDVAVLPDPDGGKGEKIVGVAAWLEPGKSVNPSLRMLLRVRPWRVTRRWGMGVLKCIFVEFEPATEKAVKKAFSGKGIDAKDSWHLTILATDPAYEGQGKASALMKEGLKRTFPKPIRLESSTEKSRDVYIHYGFEINEEQQFGKGKVDVDGVVTKKSDAPGLTVWNMTKWTY